MWQSVGPPCPTRAVHAPGRYASLSQSADAHHCRLTPYAAQGVGVEQVPKTGFARDEDEAAWQQRWPH